MSPERRDATGRIEAGPTWESLVERQIRDAMDDGAFDDLPYVGERLPIDDDSAAGDWAMAYRMLRNAGVAPPWIESDKEVRRRLAQIEAVIERAPRASRPTQARLRRELLAAVEAANLGIARVNAEAPTDRQHRRPLDPAAEMDRLERAFRAG
jgi:hypothetical protein